MAEAPSCLKTAKELIGNDELGDAAEAAAKKALSLFRSTHDSKGLADALRCLVDLKVYAGDKEGALGLVRDEVAAAEGTKNKLTQAVLLTVEAEVMIHMNDPVQALSLGSAARAILQVLGERLEEVTTIATAILPALCMQGSGDEAVAAANEMLTLGWQTGDRKTQATACQCALHAYLIGGSREAVEIGRRAVQLSKAIGDKEQEAASLVALANAHLHLQSPCEATRTAWEAMGIVKELGARKLFSLCVHTLIQALVANKQVAEAMYWGEEEIAKCQKANDKRLESLISPSVVKAYVGSGNMDVAARKAEVSLRLFQDLGNRIGECNMLKGLAELKHEAKRYEEAEAHVSGALVIMRSFKDLRGENELLCMLDHICVAKGAPEEAPHRAEALSVLHALTRALEERNAAEFRELTKRFDTIGGVTEQEIRDIFGAAVEKDQEGARDFIVKNIGKETLARASASAPQAAPKPGCFFKLVERELLYTNFRKGMMGYGPRFRCVSIPASRVGQGEAYAVLRMTSESEAWEQELSLGGGPGIMDCNLQTGAVSLYTGGA